ncbi:MAG: tetratricopeptide repeat protein, partial [Myxococcales bacterium]|nr:tetratricopeptide repeat protein [Myxococcales bacterium]
MRPLVLLALWLWGCGAAPPSASALHAQAGLKAQAGDLPGAAALYDRACEADPDQPAVWLAAADAWRRLGDWAKAAERAETATALAPEDPEPVAALAQARLNQEQPEAAR